MRRGLRFLLGGIVVFALASLLAVYGFGRFAKAARGQPGHALPADRVETVLDREIAPLTAARPGQAGIALVDENLDAFAIRALTARAAGRSLDLQYYIWHHDFTGNLLGHEVVRAADRGVRVRLLLDDMNAHGNDSVLAILDSHPRIEVRLFNPSRNRSGYLGRGMELLLRARSLNRRMHNKIWLADGRIAVVGGRNVGDEYFGAAADTNFSDADLAVVGPPVAETAAIFDAYWNSEHAIPLAALARAAPDALQRLRRNGDAGMASPRAQPYLRQVRDAPGVRRMLARRTPLHWSADVHVYSDPPEKVRGGGQDRWLIRRLAPELDAARREVRIVSPYFVPGARGMDAIAALRRRGVAVGVLTNSLAATDVLAVHGGYAGYREPLLRAGVELYELMPHGPRGASLFGSSGASLHTKGFTVDGRTGFVGSFNLDPRSIRLNTEMGILFREPAAVAELDALYRASAGPGRSYRLRLEGGQLRWDDASVQPPRVWTHEPEAGFWMRAGARCIGWLPIESQL
ncbi:MAG TPA: phospholipase D family protein [Pseudoxanthomonas sp.]|nr:phospholipase D family protein [Pseudoxanthomonas sp.]